MARTVGRIHTVRVSPRLSYCYGRQTDGKAWISWMESRMFGGPCYLSHMVHKTEAKAREIIAANVRQYRRLRRK